jgi:hypothetical protein
MLKLILVVSSSCAAPIVLTSGGLSFHLDSVSGTFDLLVDGKTWLARDTAAGADLIPTASGSLLGPPTLLHAKQNGTDKWGAFNSVELGWSYTSKHQSSETILITTVRAYSERELIVLGQTWPKGFTHNTQGSDAKAIAPYPTLVTSSAGNTTTPLNFYQWGGCQIANSFSGRWTDASSIPGGQRLGMPLLLYNAHGRGVVASPAMNWLTAVHEEGTTGGGSKNGGGGRVGVGIKASVKHLPKGFKHETVLVGGKSINHTMYNLGDALLELSGKQRINAYDDFVLSHLGYWTDNGAYYDSGNNRSGFANHENMLIAMKKQWELQKIPFRYVQWDDWQWINGSHHPDIPGPYPNWLPLPQNIPSGITDWLQMPTSLYNPMYAANTSYITQSPELGEWAVDAESAMGGSAIPLDPAYYRAAFKNGSRAQMKMFEQDFLCTYQWTTNLTTSDVTTGMQWLHAMDDAAASFTDYAGNPANTTLQLCMMTPVHALASTELMRVTNGRGTSDNLHDSQADLYKLGPSGLLLGAMGLWNSRDNVFTSPKESGCAPNMGNCTSPDYRLQNVAAVLGGGPYGPSDGIRYLNKKLIDRSCRTDGVLLKADRPLAMTDAELLVNFDATHDTKAKWSGHVWATATDVVVAPTKSYSDYALRWSYVLSVDTSADLPMTLAQLGVVQHLGPHSTNYLLWDFWATNGTGLPTTATPIYYPNSAFTVPKSPPASTGSATLSSTGTYQILAPVMKQGWCVLGEVEKIVPVSKHRFLSIGEVGSTLKVDVAAASGETVRVAVIHPSSTRAIFHSDVGAEAVAIQPR